MITMSYQLLEVLLFSLDIYVETSVLQQIRMK